jgi:hypothetical protein
MRLYRAAAGNVFRGLVRLEGPDAPEEMIRRKEHELARIASPITAMISTLERTLGAPVQTCGGPASVYRLLDNYTRALQESRRAALEKEALKNAVIDAAVRAGLMTSVSTSEMLDSESAVLTLWGRKFSLRQYESVRANADAQAATARELLSLGVPLEDFVAVRLGPLSKREAKGDLSARRILAVLVSQSKARIGTTRDIREHRKRPGRVQAEADEGDSAD